LLVELTGLQSPWESTRQKAFMALRPSVTDVAVWALVTWAADQQLHLGCKCNAGKRL